MKKLLVLLALALPLTSLANARLGYISAGPMLHWNFGGKGFKAFSYGLEAAYWNYARITQEGFLFQDGPDLFEPAYGADLGFEVDRQAFRFYAEPQISFALCGVSIGPVLEFSRKGGPAHLGIQGSGWGGLIGGWDLRYRRLGEQNTLAPGMNIKLAAVVH